MLIECYKGNQITPFLEKLSSFEKQFTYPSKNGSFSISHGMEYDRFFKSLRFNYDDPYFFIAKDDNGEILGLIVAVLQEIPSRTHYENAWYICDFKISRKIKTASVLMRLLKKLKEICLPICPKAYALSMNSDDAINKMIRFSKNNPFLNFQCGETLILQKITTYHDITEFLNVYPHAFLYRSTDVKTIIINNSQIDLWHLVHTGQDVKTEDHTIKKKAFLETPSDELEAILTKGLILTMTPEPQLEIPIWGKCSVIHTGLEFVDWAFLATCDI